MTKTLVIYLMAEPETPELARAAVEGGADIVELGIPFSDPLADGPVIRRAAERALARGMRTRACLDVLARTRELLPETPLVPMTYASILEAYGCERFVADARAAGATSLIVADLPGRASTRSCGASSWSPRPRPTSGSGSPPSRRTAGSTSSRSPARPARAAMSHPRSPASSSAHGADRPCRSTPASGSPRPSTPVRSRALADGIVVGSRALEVAEDGPEALRAYVASLRAALDG